MANALEFLKGKKTYIVTVIILALAVLSYFGVIPDMDTLVVIMTAIAAYAATFRSALRTTARELLPVEITLEDLGLDDWGEDGQEGDVTDLVFDTD